LYLPSRWSSTKDKIRWKRCTLWKTWWI